MSYLKHKQTRPPTNSEKTRQKEGIADGDSLKDRSSEREKKSVNTTQNSSLYAILKDLSGNGIDLACIVDK